MYFLYFGGCNSAQYAYNMVIEIIQKKGIQDMSNCTFEDFQDLVLDHFGFLKDECWSHPVNVRFDFVYNECENIITYYFELFKVGYSQLKEAIDDAVRSCSCNWLKQK